MRRPIFFPRIWALAWLWLPAWAATAALQFDCFPGFEGKLARSGAWYPASFEIFNDGPSFQGVIEIRPDTFSGTLQEIPIELPSNTRKRLTVPRFCGSSSGFEVTALLRDEKGKVQAEAPRSPVRAVYPMTPLLGALAGAFANLPALPEVKGGPETAPAVVRLDASFFPEDPLQLEALNAIYLNTARALELKEPQAEALLAWMHLGGHLIVALDQPGDLSALPWLRPLLPGVPTGETNAVIGPAIRAWAAGGPDLPPWSYWPGKASERGQGAGEVYAGAPAYRAGAAPAETLFVLRARDGAPPDGGVRPAWALSALRGRGRMTLLAFNPEREPFRSAPIRPWFWARLTGIPATYLKGAAHGPANETLDAALGSMVETKQVRKLPLGVLLALLVAYLLVIGPFDYWWLRKIKRPMLTWVTFPAYVVFFSGLIYFIGFKLRSGQTEWNELHFVDVVPQGGGRAALRGRMIGSLYSPQNRTYRLVAEAAHAAGRPQFRGLFTGSAEGSRLTTSSLSRKLEADLFVPVWTSEPYVVDWQDYGPAPLSAGWTDTKTIAVTNGTAAAMNQWWVLAQGRVYQLGQAVPAGGSAVLQLSQAGSTPFGDWARPMAGLFQMAMNQQQFVFAAADKTSVTNDLPAAAAASFGELLPDLNGGEGAGRMTGFDLSALSSGGGCLVLGWQGNGSPLPPVGRFPVRMSRRDTVYRLWLPPADF